jgi:acyl-CoA synthetase (AMP-forming)/AMP-acid ligase II
MRLLPGVSFVNAYGLTETSSSIADLTPDDHRVALASNDENVRRRLGSVGQALPTVEISVRDELGNPVPAGVVGEIWVRGEQVSGEYSGIDRRSDEGWFPTHDAGWFDDEDYLFVEGRLDDVIVRGGENLSPGEIEDVILDHPAVRDAVVLGIPDEEWGEVVAAVIVPVEGVEVDEESISEFVVERLRSSRRPARIEFRDELPMTATGKVLRRELRSDFIGGAGSGTTDPNSNVTSL